MNAYKIDDNKALAFLDEGSKQEEVDLMLSQKSLLRSILSLDSAENNRMHTQDVLDDDDERIQVGN